MPRASNAVELHLGHAVGCQLELVAPVEGGAPVHLAVLTHELARLALVHASIVVLGELWFKEILVVICLDLLQAQDVGPVVD